MDNKKELLQYISESKEKPALVTAKLILLAEHDEESFTDLYKLAINWVSILAEIDHDQIAFDEVYKLVIGIGVTDKFYQQIQTSYYLYIFRTQSFNERDLDEVLLELDGNNSAKSLICKMFACMYLDQKQNAYNYLTQALDKDNVVTQSILLCCGVKTLEELEMSLSASRQKGIIPCSCNTGVQNFGFTNTIVNALKTYSSSEKIAETSFISDMLQPTNVVNKNIFHVCKLHRAITDLNDMIRILKSIDKSTVLNVYLDAGRFAHALEYMNRFKTQIDKHDIKNIEKLKESHSICAITDL